MASMTDSHPTRTHRCMTSAHNECEINGPISRKHHNYPGGDEAACHRICSDAAFKRQMIDFPFLFSPFFFFSPAVDVFPLSLLAISLALMSPNEIHQRINLTPPHRHLSPPPPPSDGLNKTRAVLQLEEAWCRRSSVLPLRAGWMMNDGNQKSKQVTVQMSSRLAD